MTAEEFRTALAALGMSQARLSRITGHDKATVHRWAASHLPVPRTVELLLAAWTAHPKLIKDLTP
jgi:hypothetical protein